MLYTTAHNTTVCFNKKKEHGLLIVIAYTARDTFHLMCHLNFRLYSCLQIAPEFIYEKIFIRLKFQVSCLVFDFLNLDFN